MNIWLSLAGVNGLIGVGAGAIAAHALQARLGPRELELFETAARYQLFHSLALLAIAWLADKTGDLWPRLAGSAFLIGIVLFSGSLYVIALSGSRTLAVLAPFGGLALLLGWLCLIIAGLRG